MLKAESLEKIIFNGGILDINESEEIISDDGNDIELTAYKAAFDEPTGVKSLFQAKDGGRHNFAMEINGKQELEYGEAHEIDEGGTKRKLVVTDTGGKAK